MEEIHEFLIRNGWIDLKYGEYMSKDGMFKIAVLYDEEEKRFIVRSAILRFFDRWANSGFEESFSQKDEVITCLKGRYITNAFWEINTIFEDRISSDGELDKESYQIITRIIERIGER